jgi:hypothetical protein
VAFKQSTGLTPKQYQKRFISNSRPAKVGDKKNPGRRPANHHEHASSAGD